MIKCGKCGGRNPDDSRFCIFCGSELPVAGEYSETRAACPTPQSAPRGDSRPQQSPAVKPLSMWAYFGCLLLFCIPLVGFGFVIVWSCGGTRNPHLRAFARGALLFIIFVCLLTALAWDMTMKYVVPEIERHFDYDVQWYYGTADAADEGKTDIIFKGGKSCAVHIQA